MDRNKRFENKVALVTGGNAGIGLATARAFAQEGAKVVIAARREDEAIKAVEEITSEGGLAHFIKTDVSDADSVQNMVLECEKVFGGLDIAYNNAGITGPASTPIVDVEVSAYDQVMAINAKGVWLSMKYEFQAMLKRGGGVIVNCTSTAGIQGGIGNASAYYASKHAVVGMTKQVAVEGAKQNIRVNAIAPGMVMTDMTRNNFTVNPEKFEFLFKRIPLGRAGDLKELADTVLWLSSEESGFITGAIIPVDGGTVI